MNRRLVTVIVADDETGQTQSVASVSAPLNKSDNEIITEINRLWVQFCNTQPESDDMFQEFLTKSFFREEEWPLVVQVK